MILHNFGLLLWPECLSNSHAGSANLPRTSKGLKKKKKKEIKNRSLDRAAALLADTTGQLLVPQIHRMPWCLPTVLSNSWAGAWNQIAHLWSSPEGEKKKKWLGGGFELEWAHDSYCRRDERVSGNGIKKCLEQLGRYGESFCVCRWVMIFLRVCTYSIV